MSHKLGESKTEVQLTTVEENRDSAISLAEQARYSIDIFSQELDAEIYNNEEFEHAIIKLATRHPSTTIRILVQDARKAAQNGHCLIRLAQSLTSSVFIHTPTPQYKEEQCAFMVVDKLGFMHRISAHDRNYNATLNYMSPQGAGKLSDFFNVVWEHSLPDVQTRRIYM